MDDENAPRSRSRGERPASSTAEVASLAERDPATALRNVAEQHLPHVERLLLRMLGPRTDLEDLVQTVFLEFSRTLPRYRGEGSVEAYLVGIAVRVARRAMRRPAWFSRRSPMPFDITSTEPGPELSTIERDELRAFQTVLEKLPPPQRIAFVLWAVEGMDTTAIAVAMKASQSATRGRIFRAQRELRERIRRDPRLRELSKRFASDE